MQVRLLVVVLIIRTLTTLSREYGNILFVGITFRYSGHSTSKDGKNKDQHLAAPSRLCGLLAAAA